MNGQRLENITMNYYNNPDDNSFINNFKAKYDAYISNGYFKLNIHNRALEYHLGQEFSSEYFYIGTNNDSNVQHVIVKIPRYYEGSDLAQANDIYIYFQNEKEDRTTRVKLNIKNCYVLQDQDTNTLDEYIYIDWVVGAEVTKKHGTLLFSICLQNNEEYQINEDNAVTYIKWEIHSQETEAIIVKTLHGNVTMSPIYYDIYETDGWQGGYYIKWDYTTDEIIPIHPTLDNVIIINAGNRDLQIPSTLTLGVEHDHYAKRIYFALPKQYQDTIFDINTWDFYAQYTNALGKADNTPLEQFLIGENAIGDLNDTNYVFFSWLVPIGATEKEGLVEIAFSAVVQNTSQEELCNSNKIIRSWNSAAETLAVLPGIRGGVNFAQSVVESQGLTKTQFRTMLRNLFAEDNVIINGDVWTNPES